MRSKILALRSRISPLDSGNAAAEPDRQDSGSNHDRSFDYWKLRQDLKRAVTRVCPYWLSDQRDDLIQTAVMRVMQCIRRKAPAGEGDPPLTSSYLYRVAYSALVDEIRRVKRRRETGLDDEAVDAAAITVVNPETAMASRDIGRGILACLACMKRERRLAVTLHLQGHNIPDASRILAWPAKRTENLVYRGLADLRACLISKGIKP